MRYQKQPVTIEAVQFLGHNSEEIKAFVGDKWEETVTEVGIQTLEGFMRATPGDWIIKGVKGEFYPCKADIFEATYKPKAEPTCLMGRIIAVDFDGTCVVHAFPEVGREIGAAPVLKRLVCAGAKLILWTMRSHSLDTKPVEGKSPLQDAIDWFESHQIPLYGIQKNPTQDEWTASPKAFAHIYIDDAALGCPLREGLPGERPHVDWGLVEAMLLPKPEDGIVQT